MRRRSRGGDRAASGWAPRVVASAALLLLAVSWLPPYLALRSENAALAASSDGDVARRRSATRGGRTWDPLAVSPLLTQAMLLQQLGRNREALERLQAAAKLQPQNYEVWYELGVLQHGALGRDKAARASFVARPRPESRRRGEPLRARAARRLASRRRRRLGAKAGPGW